MRKGNFLFRLAFGQAVIVHEWDIRNMRKIPFEKREGYNGWGRYESLMLLSPSSGAVWISPKNGIKREEKDGKVIFTISPEIGIKQLHDEMLAIIGDCRDSEIWTCRRIEKHAPKVSIDSGDLFPTAAASGLRRRGCLSL